MSGFNEEELEKIQNLKEEKEKRFVARYQEMHKEDVYAMIDAVIDAANKTSENVDAMHLGGKYFETVDTMTQLINVLRGGRHLEFVRRNKWLKDPLNRQEFCNKEDDENQNGFDRSAITDFYEVVTDTMESTDELCDILDSLKISGLALVSNTKLINTCLAEDEGKAPYRDIDTALTEYCNLMDIYSRTDFFDRIDVSRDYSVKDNYEVILSDMDAKLCNSPMLDKILETEKAKWKNEFHLIDRHTMCVSKLFNDFEDLSRDAEDMKAWLENFESLTSQFSGRSKTFDYCKSLINLGESICSLLQDCHDLIKLYIKAEGVPYHYMNYPSSMYEALKTMDIQISYPAQDGGTKYSLFFESIPRIFKQKADEMAKKVEQYANK